MSIFSTFHRRLGFFISAFRHWNTVPYFGFIEGHVYLEDAQLQSLSACVGKAMPVTVAQFECKYAALIGDGQAVSFASGRMGFFVLMQELGIGKGDEVVLTGATCSVMVNAVFRCGAEPVYADIDSTTYGSDSKAIERVLSPKTKMIVAQHSFGIPCDIAPIVAMARAKNIFLLEDCALTLGSKINGETVGGFGDAALFSTDHSKPINTLTGGMIYSHQHNLILRLRVWQEASGALSSEKQRALFDRLLLERKYCHPGKYGRMAMLEYYRRIFKKGEQPFLDDDFAVECSSSYPYPARLPGFLAQLGLIEIDRWAKVAAQRKAVLQELLEMSRSLGRDDMLPSVYLDGRFDIVPLRFVWHTDDGAKQRETLSDGLDVSWTWFMQPIVATTESLECFGYHMGDCPVAESIGHEMVNVPCNVPAAWRKDVVAFWEKKSREMGCV